MRSATFPRKIVVAGVALALAAGPVLANHGSRFRRIATFPVFLNTSVDDETVAETIAAANGGNLLVYTDSETENLGFVDITDPYSPQADGTVALDGEPTSVGVKDGYALVCTNTSEDFVDTSGNLLVVDIATRTIVETIALGGQPDSLAVSPDGHYAAIAIENERDEDLGNGEPPQFPPGFVVIVDLVGAPSNWTTRTVDLIGIPDLFPQDPEPEFVDINEHNVAAVTLQENNHVVLIDLASGVVIEDFSCGAPNLSHVDVLENELIEQTESLAMVPREPDAVAWTSPYTLATADEGDLYGGSRGFTTWTSWGHTLYQAGNSIEHLVARLGHYPEERSENKGNEPESVEFGRYGLRNFLFVGSERSSVVIVYELGIFPIFGNLFPQFRQVLPAGVAPEGLVAIPERNLFVVACEDDARDDKIRATVQIYELGDEQTYPTIYSANRQGSWLPIPWGALSGLVAKPGSNRTVFAVHDSFYRESRFFRVDVNKEPAVIDRERAVKDSNGLLLAELESIKAQLPGTDDFDPQAYVNDDGTVNLDLEGIGIDGNGRKWLASEGAGNLVDGVSDPDDRPFESPNLLVRVRNNGRIDEVISLPIELVRDQLRFGFEGVAVEDGYAYVAFQRAWQAAGDPSDRARIGRCDLATGSWTFAYYPLDAPTSPNGGWVGNSDLAALGGGEFAMLERDNQGGPDAAIKRIYTFSVEGVDFMDDSQAPGFDVVSKALVSDLLADDVYGPGAGPIPEKVEGLAVLANGDALIVNDNDGTDDNNGETRLERLEDLLD